jgi:hypothetical protein
MSQDLQVIAYQGAATVRRIALFQSPVQTLDIRGEQFVDVAAVRVNEVDSPEFIVLSPGRLLARVPSSKLDAPITSVVVLSSRPDLTPRAGIFFDINVGGRVAEGQVRLVQNFLKLLLTTPGSDIFLPGSGGGLLSFVGSVTDPSGASLRSSATQGVDRAKTQLLGFQAGDASLSDDERIRSASVLAVDFDVATATLSLRVRLQSLSGEITDATMQV